MAKQKKEDISKKELKSDAASSGLHFERGDLIVNSLDKAVKTTGTTSAELRQLLLTQLVNVLPFYMVNDDRWRNAALAMLEGINPKNELECMLAVQMVATHLLSMEMARRPMVEGASIDSAERNINRTTKLMRTFIAQTDALQKLRGKGQQKITVEHVTVNEGGQAVVGNVGGGGNG